MSDGLVRQRASDPWLAQSTVWRGCREGGVLHRLEALSRSDRIRRPADPGIRGPPLGGRSDAGVHRSSRRVVHRRAALDRMHRTTRALREPPSWGGGKRNSTTIWLSSLSDSETAQLISALLSQAVLPAEVHAALLERAGGNPLYAEEFIRMLSDRGILQRKGRVLSIDPDADIPMPDNVKLSSPLGWTRCLQSARRCCMTPLWWARCSGRERWLRWAGVTRVRGRSARTRSQGTCATCPQLFHGGPAGVLLLARAGS